MASNQDDDSDSSSFEDITGVRLLDVKPRIHHLQLTMCNLSTIFAFLNLAMDKR